MGEVGRYFLLRCVANNKVLEVQDGSAMPGQRVCVADYHGDENQLWYEDQGAIRSKLDETYVLDSTKDGYLCVNTANKDSMTQKWSVSEGDVKNTDTNQTLAVPTQSLKHVFAGVMVVDDGSEDANIKVENRPVVYGYIQSYLHGMVVDCKDGKTGANIVVNPVAKPAKPNQLWYENPEGILVCKLNNIAMEMATDKTVKVAPYDASKDKQRWVIKGTKIALQGEPNKSLDIHGASSSKGAKLCSWEYNGGLNQNWFFEQAEKL